MTFLFWIERSSFPNSEFKSWLLIEWPIPVRISWRHAFSQQLALSGLFIRLLNSLEMLISDCPDFPDWVRSCYDFSDFTILCVIWKCQPQMRPGRCFFHFLSSKWIKITKVIHILPHSAWQVSFPTQLSWVWHEGGSAHQYRPPKPTIPPQPTTPTETQLPSQGASDKP